MVSTVADDAEVDEDDASVRVAATAFCVLCDVKDDL